MITAGSGPPTWPSHGKVFIRKWKAVVGIFYGCLMVINQGVESENISSRGYIDASSHENVTYPPAYFLRKPLRRKF
ncbi:hypothetical protein EVAR_36947_1 [Eumeta japonica]|uniref:Uncharacterized protein n=1 Tax=Eumeta variegata TaxID=151549 RepID=A0A4C1WAG2_EUMVA|nr:hypothetical protein EVAR_36947_1 [Eumeta japonica]